MNTRIERVARRTALATYLLAFGAAIAACSSQEQRAAVEPQIAAADPDAPIARIRIDVDPLAAEPIRYVPLTAGEATHDGELGKSAQALSSVLSSVSLYGPGVWNGADFRIRATVRITNRGGTNLNEPRMQIVAFNEPTIKFEGTHGGGGGVGGWYGYADIEKVGGANNASAKQNIVIHDPLVKPFSFTVDILADQLSTAVVPDRDDDRFNTEPLSEAAGGDCNDLDSTKFPGGAACGCANSCPDKGSSATCTTGCCADSCSDNGSCKKDCVSCSCEFSSGPRAAAEYLCAAGSSCSASTSGVSTTSMACGASSCALTCGKHGSRTPEKCLFDACTGSSCRLECSDTATCAINSCVGSSCSVACGANTGYCALSCGSGSTCAMTGCSVSSCNLTCSGAAPITCPGGDKKVCPGTPC